jgi:hypothetical protein
MGTYSPDNFFSETFLSGFNTLSMLEKLVQCSSDIFKRMTLPHHQQCPIVVFSSLSLRIHRTLSSISAPTFSFFQPEEKSNPLR